MSASLVAYLLVAVAVGVVAWDPTRQDITTVLNKTVCPIKVDIDEDPKRIPKSIKVFKCQKDPNLWCSKMNIPKNECCQTHHDNVKLECVEITDWVQVYYPESKETQTYPLSVGCACVIEEAPLLDNPSPARRANAPPPALPSL
ncbi:unnamed protein product [Diatraea saccharalis]|uniref:Uncharacterized protein n=1 Tax=Diatraea saccharalis TaxID=40085 RepID=A0A9N9RAF9_9NEOP|nr:unnamed protein product [Diatraea saccharalis]